MTLAVEGDLIQTRSEDGDSKHVIIVSVFDDPDSSLELAHSIDEMFKNYRIRNVAGTQVDQFIAEVEKDLAQH